MDSIASKIKLIAGCAVICLFSAPLLLNLHAEEKPDNTAVKKAPQTKSAEPSPADPNSKQSESTKSIDPNDLNPEEKPDNSAVKKTPQTKPAELSPADPNSKQSESTKRTDPNDLNAEEEDIFTPRISTLFTLNEAYERIFQPEFITDDGLIDYDTLRRKRQDVAIAERALKELNPAILMSMNKEQKMAFWINTYNFCMIDVILRKYPIKAKLWNIFYPDNSVKQIIGWDTKEFFEIQGFEYNLKEIEKEFLLDWYEDPRICFALHNASMGGPILRNRPYTAENINEQLDEQIKKYLKSPYGMRIDKENNILHLSNIFRMYRDTFMDSEYAKIKKFRDLEDDEKAWVNFIFGYLSKDDASYLENNDFQVRPIEFDWHLNQQ